MLEANQVIGVDCLPVVRAVKKLINDVDTNYGCQLCIHIQLIQRGKGSIWQHPKIGPNISTFTDRQSIRGKVVFNWAKGAQPNV